MQVRNFYWKFVGADGELQTQTHHEMFQTSASGVHISTAGKEMLTFWSFQLGAAADSVALWRCA
jgi:hypothetical protein